MNRVEACFRMVERGRTKKGLLIVVILCGQIFYPSFFAEKITAYENFHDIGKFKYGKHGNRWYGGRKGEDKRSWYQKENVYPKVRMHSHGRVAPCARDGELHVEQRPEGKVCEDHQHKTKAVGPGSGAEVGKNKGHYQGG